MQNTSLHVLNLMAQTLFDKKGFNILALDIHEVSSLARYFLIAEGNVEQHVIALAQAIIEKTKQEQLRPVHAEGLQIGDWVVLDYDEVVVHIFKPGLREKYALEELWRVGKVVDLEITIAN
ncbi:MAG: ribosome silencing factor [Verrucomicrobia bacterium]|nr:ribosome silencing factor [Verrucomicrobiota bacterium]MBS0645083.1 ribosome silencing factor [Verrucomicrobiota bacterium]